MSFCGNHYEMILRIELNLYWTQNDSSQHEAFEAFMNDLNDSKV